MLMNENINGMLGSVVPRALAISAGSGQPGTAPFGLATMEEGWQAECLDAKRLCHSGAKQRHKMGGFEVRTTLAHA